MKTFAKIFVSCTLLLSSASCGEWLDVMPQGMTTEENLFSDYSGYRSALNGIYQQMASPSLYGRELSWGFVSALSQYYDFGSMDLCLYREDGLREQRGARLSGIHLADRL